MRIESKSYDLQFYDIRLVFFRRWSHGSSIKIIIFHYIYVLVCSLIYISSGSLCDESVFERAQVTLPAIHLISFRVNI